MYKVTIPYLTINFRKFNQMYFDNELPEVSFIFSSKMKSVLAMARKEIKRVNNHIKGTWDNVVKLSIRFNSNITYATPIERDNTLIHEMIHIWQFVNEAVYRQDRGHGRFFQMKASLIRTKSNGEINIDRLSTCENVSLEVKEKHVIGLLLQMDNKFYCKIMNKCSEQDIQRYVNGIGGNVVIIYVFDVIRNDKIAWMRQSRKVSGSWSINPEYCKYIMNSKYVKTFMKGK